MSLLALLVIVAVVCAFGWKFVRVAGQAALLVLGVIGVTLLVSWLLIGTYVNNARQMTRDVVTSVKPTPSQSIVLDRVAEEFSGDTAWSEAALGGGTAWLPEVEEKFEADVHSSPEAAARSLGRRIAEVLEDALAHDAEPRTMRVEQEGLEFFDASSVVSSVVEVLRETLKTTAVSVETAGINDEVQAEIDGSISVVVRFPLDQITVEPIEPNQIDDNPHLKINQRMLDALHNVLTETANANTDDRTKHLRLAAEIRQKVQGFAQVAGAIQVSISGNGEPLTLTARFVEKPWVDGYAEFVSRHAGRRWLLVRSSRFASSEEEARRAALEQASRHLIEKELVDNDSTGMPTHVQNAMQSDLQHQLDVGGKYLVDRFAQCLKRPYGDVWWEAILLDLSNREPVLPRAQQMVRQHKIRKLSRTVAMVALVLVVCALYAILNTLTKGYYKTAIVCGMALLFVLGGGLLFVA